MNLNNTSERYGFLTIGLHWLMLLLFIALYACIELREFYPKGSDIRSALKTWHFMLGLTVFWLTFIRLTVRLFTHTPIIVPTPPQWQLTLAHLVHLALYAFMLLMPIMGWLVLSGEGRTIPFWGIELPALIGKNKSLAETIEEVHVFVGTLGYFLIGAHAAAALIHHYVMGDNTLRRMINK